MKAIGAVLILIIASVGIFAMYQQTSTQSAASARVASQEMIARPAIVAALKRSAVRSACAKHSDWSAEVCLAMDNEKVSIGMTAEQVRLSWGKPDKINATRSASVDHEQWVYGDQYLYLEHGALRTMQTPK